MKWIKVQTQIINGLTVHEFKCPVCKHKETVHYISKLPDACYVCETELEKEIDYAG